METHLAHPFQSFRTSKNTKLIDNRRRAIARSRGERRVSWGKSPISLGRENRLAEVALGSPIPCTRVLRPWSPFARALASGPEKDPAGDPSKPDRKHARGVPVGGKANSDSARRPCLFGGSENIRGSPAPILI